MLIFISSLFYSTHLCIVAQFFVLCFLCLSLLIFISLFFPSICLSYTHSSLSCLSSWFFSLPSLLAVGKWHVVKVPVWIGTPLGAMALPGPNSFAPVVTWTSNHRLHHQHLPCSTPSPPIRKMDKPGSSASDDRTAAQQGPAVEHCQINKKK